MSDSEHGVVFFLANTNTNSIYMCLLNVCLIASTVIFIYLIEAFGVNSIIDFIWHVCSVLTQFDKYTNFQKIQIFGIRQNSRRYIFPYAKVKGVFFQLLYNAWHWPHSLRNAQESLDFWTRNMMSFCQQTRHVTMSWATFCFYLMSQSILKVFSSDVQ